MKELKEGMDEITLNQSFIPITLECMLAHLSTQANRKTILEAIMNSKSIQEKCENYIKLIENTIKYTDTAGSKKIMNVVKLRLESAKRKKVKF